MGQDHLVNALSFPLSLVCAILAVIGICYPLSGFLADVYFGRFKIIVSSLTLILISAIILTITLVVWVGLKDTHQNMQFVMLKESVPLYSIFIGAAFFIIIVFIYNKCLCPQ